MQFNCRKCFKDFKVSQNNWGVKIAEQEAHEAKCGKKITTGENKQEGIIKKKKGLFGK